MREPGRTLNRFAVVAMVLSVFGGILGIAFGIVALRQIGRTGQRGRELAVDAIAVSIVVLLSLGGVVAWRVFASPYRTDLLYVDTGACIDDAGDGDSVTAVAQVSCAGRHDAEVFATLELHEDVADLNGYAATECANRLAAYASSAASDPSLGVRHRIRTFYGLYGRSYKILCLVADTSGPRTGSLRS
jgi:hypothetical protein